ncbi:heterokaryon incompatibility [Exophiala viscosa]|uniref:heterokaryon incompatibility n=1 Tax=Exophiala viscosa TaxID=2486360 RepID=UPI0021A07E14|nr:heterokaryon incompatibility [Exophiala viscosa]
MRLLQRHANGTLSLTDDLHDDDIPDYVVLSHTWGAPAQETNHVELTEAINSMFRWYREAARCYVYLSDVHAVGIQHNAWQDDFRNSRWFTRGWTLQELLAPRLVEFFSSEGIRLGDKISLEKEVHSITGIAVEALRGSPLSDFSVKKRMDWAAKRKTTRKEDEAYSLLGIFDIYMPLIYGERERALVRLREQIDRSIQGPDPSPYSGTNAPSTSVKSLHPVRKNYRKVHVTILYWEVDEVFDTVRS